MTGCGNKNKSEKPCFSSQAMQQHELQTKANNTYLLQLQIFRLSARVVSSLFTVASHPWPTVKQRRASIIETSTIRRANTCMFSGASANTGPRYQKLYARVTHIWGNHKGQPDPSAMKGPCLESTASLITVPPASGKVFLYFRRFDRPQVQCLSSINYRRKET